jgi:hypothetical protein
MDFDKGALKMKSIFIQLILLIIGIVAIALLTAFTSVSIASANNSF